MVENHLEKQLIGYARVSTYGQMLDAQLDQLRAAGCANLNIYRERLVRVQELRAAHISLPPIRGEQGDMVPDDE